jgi:hypothetical protein
VKTYIHIPLDGPIAPFTITAGTPEYKQLQAKVGGDIEGVRIPMESHMLYVNESGLIQPNPRLNKIATRLARQPIVGDVVIAGPVDDEGDNESVSAEWLSWVKEQSR